MWSSALFFVLLGSPNLRHIDCLLLGRLLLLLNLHTGLIVLHLHWLLLLHLNHDRLTILENLSLGNRLLSARNDLSLDLLDSLLGRMAGGLHDLHLGSTDSNLLKLPLSVVLLVKHVLVWIGVGVAAWLVEELVWLLLLDRCSVLSNCLNLAWLTDCNCLLDKLRLLDWLLLIHHLNRLSISSLLLLLHLLNRLLLLYNLLTLLRLLNHLLLILLLRNVNHSLSASRNRLMLDSLRCLRSLNRLLLLH